MKKNLTDVLKGFPSSFIKDLSPERDCKETKDFLIYFYNIITLIEFAWAFHSLQMIQEQWFAFNWPCRFVKESEMKLDSNELNKERMDKYRKMHYAKQINLNIWQINAVKVSNG